MTTTTSAHPVFAGANQKADEWLRELMHDLDWEDPHRAYAALRATLHVLRDRLTIAETAQLAAQLPLLIRGVWYEGWSPKDKPVAIRHLDDFHEAVKGELRRDVGVPIPDVARAVFRLLARHVSPGEITDVMRTMPQALRALWP